MNKVETLVYNMVRKNPALKQFVRNLYQSIFDMIPRKKEFFSGSYDYKEGYFFGFHDISPLSVDETKLLAMRFPFDFQMPRQKDALEVGYFQFTDGKLGNWKKIGESFAWNFHKGCRLQWLDNENIIYNTAVDGSLCAKITNVNTNRGRIINYPIDSVFVDDKAKIATSFSYERLERCMPGYGYPYSDDGFIDVAAPENSGLFLIDLESGDRELLLNLHEIALKVNKEIEQEYLHFVTHSEFSHDGRFISFLYRRIPRHGNYMKRRSVMCVYDLIEHELLILPTQESGSHYVWNSKNQIVASVNLNGHNCHALFCPCDINFKQMIDSEHLNSDGHQSFMNDYEFITDTYPDKFRMANLYRCNIQSNDSKLIASVYSPKKYQTKDFHCHIACDLHPRVIGAGKYVCFDSPRSGVRGLYVMKL